MHFGLLPSCADSMGWRMRFQWQHIRARDALLLSLFMVLLAGVLIHAMGQPLICKCGNFKFWHGSIADSEVSQHFIDWYTPHHVARGIVIYGILWLFMQRRPSLGFALIVAALFASGWEIFENTPLIIRSFGHVTGVPDYTGDSVINSIGDMLATMLGGALASSFPIWSSALLLVLLAVLPRDNTWPVVAVLLDW